MKNLFTSITALWAAFVVAAGAFAGGSGLIGTTYANWQSEAAINIGTVRTGVWEPIVEPGLPAPPTIPDDEEWQPETDYPSEGTVVTCDGRRFLLAWEWFWPGGAESNRSPCVDTVNGPRMEFGQLVTMPNGQVVRSWTESWIYVEGDIVEYDGQFYQFNSDGQPRNYRPIATHGGWVRLEFDV